MRKIWLIGMWVVFVAGLSAQVDEFPLGSDQTLIQKEYAKRPHFQLKNRQSTNFSRAYFSAIESSLFGDFRQRIALPVELLDQKVETLTWIVQRSGSDQAQDLLTIVHQFFHGRSIYSSYSYKQYDNFSGLQQVLRHHYPAAKVTEDWSAKWAASLPDGSTIVLQNSTPKQLVNPKDPTAGLETGITTTSLVLTSPQVKAIQDQLKVYRQNLKQALTASLLKQP